MRYGRNYWRLWLANLGCSLVDSLGRSQHRRPIENIPVEGQSQTIFQATHINDEYNHQLIQANPLRLRNSIASQRLRCDAVPRVIKRHRVIQENIPLLSIIRRIDHPALQTAGN